MKLQDYLIEQEEGLAHFIPKIQAECKPFLKDIRNAAGSLFRDDTKNRNKPVWKKVTRTDRAPLDTPKELHDLIDNWFLKEFGWKARSNALFCWPLRFNSGFVPNKWLVFPAGNYKYVWSSEVDDLWSHTTGGNGLDRVFTNFINYYGTTYTDKNLKKSMLYETEVMVNCKYSYLARAELMEPLNEALGLNWQGAIYKGRKIP